MNDTVHFEKTLSSETLFEGRVITLTKDTALLENGAYSRTLRQWDTVKGAWQEVQQSKTALQNGDRVIALVNNLGATPLSELYGVYNRLAQRCEASGIIIERNLIGSYCTSLDMAGFSITLLKVDDETLTLWDAPVHTPALNWGN